MWTCPYCGGTAGQPFHDNQLNGMLCLDPDCGRFVEDESRPDDWVDSDF